jgi:ATPase subunit of ABC transporter with duplicated ATPase domains
VASNGHLSIILKEEIMLLLKNVAYAHPDKTLLFDNVSLALEAREKIALIGNNGSGKTTLLKIIAGDVQPSAGMVSKSTSHYMVPQIFGQFDHLSIAQALGVQDKLSALHAIIAGDTNKDHFTTLDDDWTIEERCVDALKQWELPALDLSQKLNNLSGGQKVKVFLAGITIHEPDLVLLDEPSNHLDTKGRQLLYDLVQSTPKSVIVISHDRTLLNLLHKVGELKRNGITLYGGNYDFYADQKVIEESALTRNLESTEKALRHAKEKERETLARQQKLDNRGKSKQEKAGVARIMMNTLRNSAENSTSKLKSVH